MIIIEGADGTGKSVLAYQLACDLKMVQVKNHANPKTIEDIDSWCQLIKDFPLPLLLDRTSVISEPVYGPICRGKELITRSKAKAWINQLQPIIVYCRLPLEAIQLDKPQMKGVKENIKEIVQAYDLWIEEIGQTHQVYSYDYTSSPVAYSFLVKTLKGVL